jgi:hypothetical protein
VQRQQIAFVGRARERVRARIAPDVTAIATILAELNIIAMRARPDLKTKTNSCWLR